MTLSPNLLAEAEAFAKSYNPKGYTDAALQTAEWLFQRLCELSDARFDFHQIVDSPEFEEFCDSHSFCVTSENHTLAYQAAAFGARHQHSLNMAALLREREEIAQDEVDLQIADGRIASLLNDLDAERAKAERLEKALREIAENVDDISSYEIARQALDEGAK